MIIHHAGINTLEISNECYNENRRTLRCLNKISEDRFFNFLINDSYARLCISNPAEFLSQLEGVSGREIKKVAILHAHGKRFFNTWTYSDGLFPKKVQTWIDKHDNNYDLLLLHSCNPGHFIPYRGRAIVLQPLSDLSILGNIAGDEHLLTVPGKSDFYLGKGGLKSLAGVN